MHSNKCQTNKNRKLYLKIELIMFMSILKKSPRNSAMQFFANCFAHIYCRKNLKFGCQYLPIWPLYIFICGNFSYTVRHNPRKRARSQIIALQSSNSYEIVKIKGFGVADHEFEVEFEKKPLAKKWHFS